MRSARVVSSVISSRLAAAVAPGVSQAALFFAGAEQRQQDEQGSYPAAAEHDSRRPIRFPAMGGCYFFCSRSSSALPSAKFGSAVPISTNFFRCSTALSIWPRFMAT